VLLFLVGMHVGWSSYHSLPLILSISKGAKMLLPTLYLVYLVQSRLVVYRFVVVVLRWDVSILMIWEVNWVNNKG
jgi:hypothetical protein